MNGGTLFVQDLSNQHGVPLFFVRAAQSSLLYPPMNEASTSQGASIGQFSNSANSFLAG
jgi:hypothetical protein